MILDQPYNKDRFEDFLNVFIPDFVKDNRPVRTHENSILTQVLQIGTSKETNLTILEAVCEETDSKKRIAITQAAFRVLRDHSIRNALIAFHDGADQWRLSLLTSSLELKDGKVIKKDSNPRRYSYLLGVGAKTRTPYKYLIEKAPVSDIKSLQSRFSVEVVNKQFYESIANLFTKLVGGERGSTRYPGSLLINGEVNQSVEHQEFAVRLIGRIIFSWFLKEKKSSAGVPIIPSELLSLDAVASNRDYYHNVLELLFFELLNRRIEHRHETLREAPFSTVPYLNGGLFSSQPTDFYNQIALNHTNKTELTKIPDEWFTDLFTLLEQYNFTVDENTSYDVDLSIDPEMLGRIFENLLAEINPETGESARKSTGSFYTPREIVDYMVDSSLVEFLKSKTGLDEQKLKALISWGKDDDEMYPLSNVEKENVVSAMANLTILDPACGSGAFPIGILQKVVYILQQVDDNAELWLQNQLKSVSSPELRHDIEEKYRNENYDYLRKLGVIRESIFGIDIQTIATEISKLRCFLTLVIEEEVDDSAQNRGIRALPNLDFKFVTANSLIGLPESSETKGLNLFEDASHIDRLKEIRNRYFVADADERTRLQVEFKDLQLTMFKSRLASMGATSDLYNILSDWNPFNHEMTEWFDAEWMFGIEGFDIVIANPPYVGEKGHKTMFEQLKQTTLGKKFYKGKMDLFYLFFHLGLNNLNERGILSFISTNYYPTADGALKLRKDFHERTNVLELINFNEYKIFESALGQHNLITLLQKSVKLDDELKTKQTLVKKRGGPNASELNSYLQRIGEDATYNEVDRSRLFDGDKFYIRFANTGSAIDTILDKVAINGRQLSELCLVSQGIVSGADKFSDAHHRKYPAINANKGDGIFVFSEVNLEFNYLKPWFKNSDIRRYNSAVNNQTQVLYLTPKCKPQEEELAYLSKFRPILDNRREVTNGKIPWWSLQWGRNEEIFSGPKIVAPQRSKINTFAYNDIPWYGSADIYFITNKVEQNLNLKSILGILNSKLMYAWLYNRGKRKGETLELYGTPLSQIPIVLPKGQDDIKLTSIVENIMTKRSANAKANIVAQEDDINKIVYSLYNLTEDEIGVIEDSYKLKY